MNPCHRSELLTSLAYCGELCLGDIKCFVQWYLCLQNEARIYFFCPLYSLLHYYFVQLRQNISFQLLAAVCPVAYVINIVNTWEMIIRGASLTDTSFCHLNQQCKQHNQEGETTLFVLGR